MRSGLLSMFLVSLATTAAAPQTHLDELRYSLCAAAG